MNTAMEMHDSYLQELHTDEADGSGHALFHAVVFRSEGVLGEDAQESGWQNVRMQFTNMVVEGNWTGDRPYASDGFLSLDGVLNNGFLRFPRTYTASIVLSMELSNDFETTTIKATSISIDAEGDFECEHIWDEAGHPTPYRT